MRTSGASAHNEFDYLIIGAGPGGLQLAYYLEEQGRDYLILEAGDTPGTFFKRFPRHRALISANKVYTGYDDPEINLRWDWNSLLSSAEHLLLKHYSKRYFPDADILVRYLADFAEYFNLKIKYSTRVTNITKDDGFMVTDSHNDVYRCSRLVVATGFSRAYIPPIPGVELTENYTDVSVDPDDFADQKVLIIGKGNSGFETADNLIETAAVIHVASPTPLKFAWKTHFVGHLRAVNNNVLDTYQLKSQNAIIDGAITRITRKKGKLAVAFSYSHADGENEELYYDRVILCTGFRFDHSVFDQECKPVLALNDRFPELTSEWESANIDDLYFAGTLMQVRDFKKTTSGFIHGFRYNIRALHRMFEKKYHGIPWPSLPVEATSKGLTDAVIRRINTSSALWQQFGFLCDLIIVPPHTMEARYFEELPVAYVHDSEFGRHSHYYTITLEFGKCEEDPFNNQRHPDPARADASFFLHPVIRRFDGRTQVSEQHLLEDLAGEWLKEDVHISPLRNFFAHHAVKLSKAG